MDTKLDHESLVAHTLPDHKSILEKCWTSIQNILPDTWKWDIEYHKTYAGHCMHLGAWTLIPLKSHKSIVYPLTIAKAPIIVPVEYRWPLLGGVNPPPDPRPSSPIDCHAELSLEVIVPSDFDTSWASSHLPQKYGGLKVCYIEQYMEPTMLPTKTATGSSNLAPTLPDPNIPSIFVSHPSSNSIHPALKDIRSPVPNLGWLNHASWASLRQNSEPLRFLSHIQDHRAAKSPKCIQPSEILIVGEGIFLNQTCTPGGSKTLKDHDMSTWEATVSRALLYRVFPDFDPTNDYSGIVLYANGFREDGTVGPGLVGFQSFVQRSSQGVGRVAFYGAFEVPDNLKRDYTIV